MISSASKKFKRQSNCYLKIVESQVKKWRIFKDRKTYPFNFWLKTLRDSKVEAGKDRGETFQSRLAASFCWYHTVMG